MSNCCCNKMVVYGNEEELQAFYEMIKSFENKRLGDVLIKAGYDIENISCRATIENVERDRETVLVYYDSAWTPCIETFDMLLNDHYPNLKEVTIGEECGCEVYINTDTSYKYIPDKYMVDSCINGDYETEYFAYNEEDKFVKYYNELTGRHCTSAEEVLNDDCECDDEDDFVYTHEFVAY